MLKANIKLPIWLVIVAVSISTIFALFDFTPLAIIIYLGSLYLIIYYIRGQIKRVDALIIDDTHIKVQSPFKYREWEIASFDSIFLVDGNSQIKGITTIDDEEKQLTICTAIYDKNLSEILQYILTRNPKLHK